MKGTFACPHCMYEAETVEQWTSHIHSKHMRDAGGDTT